MVKRPSKGFLKGRHVANAEAARGADGKASAVLVEAEGEEGIVGIVRGGGRRSDFVFEGGVGVILDVCHHCWMVIGYCMY